MSKACTQTLKWTEDWHASRRTRTQPDIILQLLKINLERSNFMFDNKWFLQTKGTAMGKCFSQRFCSSNEGWCIQEVLWRFNMALNALPKSDQRFKALGKKRFSSYKNKPILSKAQLSAAHQELEMFSSIYCWWQVCEWYKMLVKGFMYILYASMKIHSWFNGISYSACSLYQAQPQMQSLFLVNLMTPSSTSLMETSKTSYLWKFHPQAELV